MYAAKLGGRPSAEHQTADALVRALSARHPELGDHVDGVAELAVAVAERLGMDEHGCTQVRHAAQLHDIGKVAVPDSIIGKPGPLDEDEWAFVRRHTVIGERILAGVSGLATAAKQARAATPT